MSADWPGTVPPPLFEDHGPGVLDIWAWSSLEIAPMVTERYARQLVLPRCPSCGSVVMEVVQPERRDGHGGRWLSTETALVIGTKREHNAGWMIERSKEVGERRVDVSGRWTALLDSVPTPTLPAYCAECGDLEVDVRELRRSARRVIAEDRPVDKKVRGRRATT